MTIQTAFQILIKWVFLVVFSLQLQGCGGGSSAEPLPQLGQITININGLDPDTNANVDLAGNVNGTFTIWQVPQSRTITGIPEGTYAVRSRSFSAALKEYIPQQLAISIDLAEGESVTAEVFFDARDIVPASISLTIDSTLLPAGSTASAITLQGPEGYSESFNSNSEITGLVPGVYQFIAPDFITVNQGYGYFLEIGNFRLSESEQIQQAAVISPVPARFKSVSNILLDLIDGTIDQDGNSYKMGKVVVDFSVHRHFIRKWNTQGVEVLRREIPGLTHAFWDWKVAVDDDGNIYLGGYEEHGNLFGGIVENLPSVMIKYSPTGDLVWQKSITDLTGSNLPKIEQIGIQNGKIAVFSTHYLNSVYNKHINIMDQQTGDLLSKQEGAISNNGGPFFTSFKSTQTDGYWTVSLGDMTHYSDEGIEIESLQVGGSAHFVLDPLGGFYVTNTVAGLADWDIQLTRYNDDLSVDWQQVLTNDGDDYARLIGYDSNSGKILITFRAVGNFPGFTSGSSVTSEWDNTGQQIWLRQHDFLGGAVTIIEKNVASGDWLLKINSNTAGGQYGNGNVLQIGP